MSPSEEDIVETKVESIMEDIDMAIAPPVPVQQAADVLSGVQLACENRLEAMRERGEIE